MGLAVTDRSISALLYDELEYYEEAIREYGSHLLDFPGNVAALNNRAIAYWEIGEAEKARADFLNATRLSTADPLPFKHYGMFLEGAGDLEGAIEQYGAGLRISPNDAPLNRCMAFALAKSNRHAEAVAFFSRAIRSDRRFRQTYLDRAAAYDKVGMRIRARIDRWIAQLFPVE